MSRLRPGSAARVPLPGWVILLYVSLATGLFGALNVLNAHQMAPNWGQDLAFFHQLVHSAAHGGPWASPLLLEPQGFLAMVHTHLVLPLVVLAYWLVPRQETLLVWHAFCASLALWPAIRLGEACGGRRLGLMAGVALMVFGPFQGLATADFRPSVLFLPGVLGVFAMARSGRTVAMLAWALVAIVGRQEAPYLLGAAGGAMLLFPWSSLPRTPGSTSRLAALGQRWWAGLRHRQALALIGLAVLCLGLWVAIKPSYFFHFDPLHPPAPTVIPPDVMERRVEFGVRMLGSGWILGLLSPTALLAGLPVLREMLATGREWHALVGASAHYPAFWLPFVVASGIAGAGRLPRWGGYLLVGLNLVAFPWVGPRTGPTALRALSEGIDPTDRVAADYDTIHLLSGRAVLWNIEQIDMPDNERPYAWTRDWPLRLSEVDVVVMPADHRLASQVADWKTVRVIDTHVVRRRPRP